MSTYKKMLIATVLLPFILVFIGPLKVLAEIPPSDWLTLPLGLSTQIGYLPCPLSKKEKDWMTFGKFVDDLYSEETGQKDYKATLTWKKGEKEDIWILTINRITEKNKDESQGIMVFRKITTPNGNVIISLERISDSEQDLAMDNLPDVWNQACQSHTGLGWKIYLEEEK